MGDRSFALHDVVVGDGTGLEALPLVMKGEKLPDAARGPGIPAGRS